MSGPTKFMVISPEVIAGWMASAGAIAGGVWMWLLRQKKNVAETRAEVAESNAATARAEASDSVFTLVTRRLESVENQLDEMRTQLVERDRTIGDLRARISILEHTLHIHNIEVPR